METDLFLARRAALAGAAVGLRFFAALADLPRELKADGSVVTEADRAVEAAIREVLTAARPGDAILGEEGGHTDGHRADGPARQWIIDPIDGTALFVAGDDRWLVLVALEQEGEIVVGVAAIPAQGRMWWAERGAGAYEATIGGAAGWSTGLGDAAPERAVAISVAHDRAGGLRESRLGVLPSNRAIAAPLLAVVADVPWALHPALLVARGDLDLALQTNGQVWDFAATSLIVVEAGGHYSGLDGRTRPAAGPSLYSRSPELHGAALTALGYQQARA